MGMVTLAQQQQQTLDGNHQCQKEQNHVNGAAVSAESHAVDKFRGEAARSARETAVVAPGNGSAGDSSTQCSDVDDDDEEEETDVEEDGSGGGWITNLPVSSTIVQQHQAVATTNGDVVLPNADPSNFGDICVKNSTNVHLGNKTFYKGPVTIKQFVYTNPISVQDVDNKFDVSRASDVNVSHLSTNKNEEVSNGSIFPQNTELNKVTRCLWTWRCAALSCVLALILLATIVVTVVYFTQSHHSTAPVFPQIPDSSIEGITVNSVRFVERNEWGAQPPSEPLTKLKLPVPYVIISHTATDFCTTQSQCTFHVRFAQTFHIESRQWSDIAYNFLVGGDGLAYVGRSWDYVGAHSFGFNKPAVMEKEDKTFSSAGYTADGINDATAMDRINLVKKSQRIVDFTDFIVQIRSNKVITWKIVVALLCVLILLLLATIIVVTTVYFTHQKAPEIPSDSSPEGITETSVTFGFVERNEWGAQPPSGPLTKLKLPVPYVIISHTTTDFCTTKSQCTFHVKFAQTYHIESRQWSDIAYNFLVGGDGLAYVGRSWDYVGAHSFGFNSKSIGISFIGTFN
ncbi:PREDICTED: peptidoglycan-recognition protein LC-like, partial [Wasmannia auropunctata]|uniref:peptidoglycan-recognition protein LC-like n=1 Tax=Wasmannia auropunctata TaxID=64793 RepID=UPI0005F0176E